MRMRGDIEAMPLRLRNNHAELFGRKLHGKRVCTGCKSAACCHHFDEIGAEPSPRLNRARDGGGALHLATHEITMPSQRCERRTAQQQMRSGCNAGLNGAAQRERDSVPVSAIARGGDSRAQKRSRVLRGPQQQSIAVLLHHGLARGFAPAQRKVHMGIDKTRQKSRVPKIDDSR